MIRKRSLDRLFLNGPQLREDSIQRVLHRDTSLENRWLWRGPLVQHSLMIKHRIHDWLITCWLRPGPVSCCFQLRWLLLISDSFQPANMNWGEVSRKSSPAEFHDHINSGNASAACRRFDPLSKFTSNLSCFVYEAELKVICKNYEHHVLNISQQKFIFWSLPSHLHFIHSNRLPKFM